MFCIILTMVFLLHVTQLLFITVPKQRPHRQSYQVIQSPKYYQRCCHYILSALIYCDSVYSKNVSRLKS